MASDAVGMTGSVAVGIIVASGANSCNISLRYRIDSAESYEIDERSNRIHFPFKQ